MEKLSFSLKLVSGHFYGQSFIKTARGPLRGHKSALYTCISVPDDCFCLVGVAPDEMPHYESGPSLSLGL